MSKIEEIERYNKNYILIEGFFDFIKEDDSFQLKYKKDAYWLTSGYAEEVDIKIALLECGHDGVDKEGEWHCKILFSVENDGDGYNNWIYLESEESEYNLIQTFIQRERQGKIDELLDIDIEIKKIFL